MVNVTGILETALYVDDLARSAAFYQSLFGFAQLVVSDRLIALAVHDRQVLLLFRKQAARDLNPGAHDGDGQLHLAFAIAEADLDGWRERLRAQTITIVDDRRWGRGGYSLYFRDPDGHLIELGSPGIWENY